MPFFNIVESYFITLIHCGVIRNICHDDYKAFEAARIYKLYKFYSLF